MWWRQIGRLLVALLLAPHSAHGEGEPEFDSDLYRRCMTALKDQPRPYVPFKKTYGEKTFSLADLEFDPEKDLLACKENTIVYRAYMREYDKVVVYKQVNLPCFQNARREECFLAATQFRGVIPELYCVDASDPGYIGLIMEYFWGVNLGDDIYDPNWKQFPHPAWHSLLERGFGVLNFLHTYGLLYRDWRPENIIVSPDLRQVHIIDFGLVGPQDEVSGFKGIPQRAAPELYPYHQSPIVPWCQFDRAEWYSFGLTLLATYHGPAKELEFISPTPADLCHIPKGFFVSLFRGLLCPKPEERWTMRKVQLWFCRIYVLASADQSKTIDTPKKDVEEENEQSQMFPIAGTKRQPAEPASGGPSTKK